MDGNGLPDNGQVPRQGWLSMDDAGMENLELDRDFCPPLSAATVEFCLLVLPKFCGKVLGWSALVRLQDAATL